MTSRPCGTGMLLVVLSLSSLLAAAAQPPAKPNILVILADDMGYADVGFNGCKDYPTPNIDALARQGVRFTDGYVSSVMCSPSRAGLLTGRSQSRFGHEINWEGQDPSGRKGLPLAESTMADQLKAAGYRTGIVGKWHLGDAPQHHPNRRGFDEFFGFTGGGHRYFCDILTAQPPQNKSSEYLTLLERNGTPEKTTGYLTDLLGREGAAFIHRHKDEPWFLYAAFNAPHTPLDATPELLERVKEIKDEQRRAYAALVTGLDDAVGALLAQLRADGLDERTLVFFLSDNGGPLDRNGSLNTPLNGEKGKVLEGGIRVPFLLRWTGVLPAGTAYRRPVSSLDILPTALAVAGAKSVAAQPLDGVNILPFVKGEAPGDPHAFLFWRVKPRAIWAVRAGDDKLCQQKFPAPRLFDLAADIDEQADLASAKPERRAALQAAWDAWSATLPEPLWGMEESASGTPAKRPAPPAKARKEKN